MIAVNHLLETFESTGYNAKAEFFGRTKRYIFGIPESFGQKEVWQLTEAAKKFVEEDGAPILNTYFRFMAKNTAEEVKGFIPPHILIIDAFIAAK